MRKTLTLPSGATCIVRPLRVGDFALHGQEAPLIYADPETRRKKAEPTPREVEAAARMMRLALLCCCSPLTYPDRRRVKIVDREMDQTAPNEITIGELSDDDAQAIFAGVAELTGMGKEAAQAAKPFPEEQTPACAVGPAGEALRDDPGQTA